MASNTYSQLINNSIAVPDVEAPFTNFDDLQFSSDLFVDFESPIFSEDSETSSNAAIHKASKKICKPAPVSEGKEVAKTSCYRRARKGRNPWTPKEDAQLMELMKKYGQSWAMISSVMVGRTGKQVRDRYLNKLRPHIKCGDWSVEEDELLVSICKEVGNRWSLIATQLPGRTEAQVKNRYYSHIKKRLDSNGALSQTTASRSISEGFNSAIASPQTEELTFDQGYNFNMFNYSSGSETASTVQSVNPSVFSSPYGNSYTVPADYAPYTAQENVFAPIQNDSQIDGMLSKVTNHYVENTNKATFDIDSFFADDLQLTNNFAEEKNASIERFDQLNKRKAYLELALAKTLNEMKGL